MCTIALENHGARAAVRLVRAVVRYAQLVKARNR
jgi:hypothetical protein